MGTLLDVLQGASNAAASNVSAPVDGIAWLLRKAGIPIPQNALLSSQWMAEKGLLAQPKNKLAGMAGETLGLLAPVAAVAKAPQIAGGLLAAQDAGKRGAMAVGQKGADMAEGYMSRAGMIQYMTKPEYGMAHRPVTVEGGASRLHDLVGAFGDDIYGPMAAQYYGTGNAALDRETLRVLKSVRGKPDAIVTVYRAVPADVNASTFNPGDWVTVNRRYAQEHGEGFLGGKYKIVEQKVPASWLTTNADSFHEQGFYPPGL